MKKIISGALAGVFCATAVFGMVACAKKNTEDPIPDPDVAAPAFSDPSATLSVDATTDANNPNMVISEELFGAFLEDINYASYALDDNYVYNGNFDILNTSASNPHPGWSTVGNAALSIGTTDGILSGTSEYAARNVNPKYAAVKVNAANAGISNAGWSFTPIAMKEGTDYKFSAFVKSPEKATKMTVKVTDGTTTYLEQEIDVAQNASWVKYLYTITASGTATANLKFQITFNTTGNYYLDAIALETTESTVGIKNYIYDAIKDMGAKFIRFPGGCIIEGDSAAGGANCTEVYDWKNSVGAVKTGNNAGDDTIPAFTYATVENGTAGTATTYGEAATRTPNSNLWGYEMEYNLGFFEYFKLCESVGASAVPVLNCGLSDQGGAASGAAIELNGRHGQKVNDYIRDAIDLIEFAKGATTTKWGKIRADMGHPEPFEMNYLGIGNEQKGDYFAKYYEKFLADADFKAALNTYGIKPIVGNGMFLTDCEDPDAQNERPGTARKAALTALDKGIVDSVAEYGVHDHHYYVNYTLLFENTHLYDYYLRKSESATEYYEVFVGEYSANEGDKGAFGRPGYSLTPNSWITALSEAAMMTGFERNGDIVKLAAYAPMFANWNGNRNWGVDMMYYTNTQLVLSTNYYVQQLFMKNAGTLLTKSTSVTYASGFASRYDLPVDAGSTATPVEIDKLYYVVSVDGATGDIIVKIVNASPEAIKVNVELKNAKLYGLADVTVLQNDDYLAVNTLDNLSSPAISPTDYTIGKFTDSTLGYEAPKYSVTAIRVHVK